MIHNFKQLWCCFLLILTLIGVSCSNTTDASPELILAKEEMSFGKAAESSILAIKSNVAWTATSSQSWCTVSPASGEAGTRQLTVAVTANTTADTRTAVLSIKAGELTKEVKITQVIEKFALDKKNVTVDASGADIVVNALTSSTFTSTIVPSWITLKSTSTDGKTQTFTIAANPFSDVREGKVLYECGSVKDTLTVTQSGKQISIPDDATGMSSTAQQLAQKIKVGLNIGNTLEATGGETGWGNPKITNDLIVKIKQSGFNAVRLPCAWDQYADKTTLIINPTWLSRVKEVVQYCVNNGLYVMVNIHWDGGWLENNCTEAKKAENLLKQKAYWEQIAVTLREFDEHVLFASANEPNVADATQMSVLMAYHQTFINTVRATGGRNANRVLVVQGPATDIEKTNQLMNQLPTDKVANKMMVEVHYYTPWNFCGLEKDETWGNMFYYWGSPNHSTTDTGRNPTWGEESTVDTNLGLMKKKFVDKGIPVIIGEFGAMTRSGLTGDALKLHLASRAYYFKYITKQALANGMLPFFWDTGGLINRTTYTVTDQLALDGLMQGAN